VRACKGAKIAIIVRGCEVNLGIGMVVGYDPFSSG